MLMRSQMTSLNTDANFALPGMVARVPQSRGFAIKLAVGAWKWRTGGQRERE